MLSVGDQAPFSVEDGATEVQALLDVHAHGGVLQDGAGLLGHCHEQVVEQLQQHGVGAAGAGGGAVRPGLGAAQDHVVLRRHLGGPAGFDHGGGVGLADQRRAGQAVPGAQVRAFIDRGGVLGAAGPHGDGVHRRGSRAVAVGQPRLDHLFPGGNRLHRKRLGHHGAARRGKAEAAPVHVVKGGQRARGVGQRHRQCGLGPLVAEVDGAADGDGMGVRALVPQPGGRGPGQIGGQAVQRGHCLGLEPPLHRLLPQHRLVRQAHAVGGQHAREGVDEHRLHPQLVRHQAGVLAARPAEARQGEAGGVVPFLGR